MSKYIYMLIGVTEPAAIDIGGTPSPPIHTRITVVADSAEEAVQKGEAMVPGCDKYIIAEAHEKTQ